MPSPTDHETPGEDALPSVVVGVDGSEASKQALRWAADYARLTGGQLRAVTAWEWPISMVVALPTPESFDPMDEAHQTLDGILAEVVGDAPGIPITTQVVAGPPASVLLDEAAGAALLVVGSRGYGGFAGLLLGSVSDHCARHAPCPVVIIRHQRRLAA
jgi:nucleotide-binding universal stress UspA family protein